MSSISFDVQKAVDSVLIVALDALTPPVPVFDHVPHSQPMPFVVFSRVIVTPENLLARKLRRVQIPLTVFSSFRGQEEVQEILQVIDDALDDARLTLSTGHAVRCDLERSDTTRDADGVTYMGSAIYSVLVDTET